ncbi:MAG: hypothetical protein M9939_01365 [Mesorhizobium sp.]|nr:hypothetical protein [Mesorhizobium sp.]MCO5159757.1 hypothetical protein [Mesorhizobium sp.]
MQPLSTYKEQYEFEIDRKDRIESSIHFPVSIIVGVSISGIYIIEKIVRPELIEGKLAVIFAAVAIVIMAIASSIIVYSYVNARTAYLDHPVVLEKHKADLIEHDRENGAAAYEDFLITRYRDIATLNGQRNDQKSELFYKAKVCIVIGMIPFLAAVVLYVIFITQIRALFDV